MTPTLAQMKDRAGACYRAGDMVETERLCRAILAQDRAFEALYLLALVAVRRKRAAEAVPWLDEALALDPRAAEARLLRAVLHERTGRYAEAIADCDAALAATPQAFNAWLVRGTAHHRLGRFEEALADADRAIAVRPALAGALANRGAALKALERFDEALAAYDAALAIDPGLPEALINRAAALVELKRFAEALASCDDILARMPQLHEAWHNRGVALVGLMRYGEAVASYSRALSLAPNFAQALQCRGSALGHLRRFEDAERDFARALACDPELPFVHGNLLHARLHCALWGGFAAEADRLTAAVRAGKRASEPLSMVAIAQRPDDQLACARTWMQRYYRPRPPLAPALAYRNDRIRVAYLSADFHEHATAYLMAELFERHDRARFEVSAVSWDVEAPSAMRTRLRAAFEHFVDVRDMDDVAVAHWLREREIDIAVDLKGYTFEARLGVFAQRPAPVQVNYLGFPGTLGAPYIDYIVADETVIPPQDRAHYAEQVVYLPGCYQPNDRKREIAAVAPPRSALGLPEAGFVFCSFNNNYKITPPVFDVWMRLLLAVPGSVLWLLEGNAVVADNLRREARARGVAPERLVFAPRAPLPEHLARHGRADLFLDTLPCNAHTTASDALWAGLPVLTCLGGTFAGRVAGSLVRAAGLPDLAVASLAEYEALALRLAGQPDALAAVRARLAAGRERAPLFDSERSCRNLEAAFRTMWERSVAGLPPAAFAVAQ